jgi:hypothetical protein
MKRLLASIPVETALLCAYFLLGLTVFDDYGNQWDELLNRAVGIENIRIAEGVGSARFSSDEHGPFYEMLLISIESSLDINFETDSRTAHLLRHFLSFLTYFIGLVLFTLLCKRLFSDKRITWFALLSFMLSPRLFADSFYNTSDIAFLTATILCTCTFYLLLTKFSVFPAVVHALSCAIATDIRLVGILYAAMTLPFMIGLAFLPPISWSCARKKLLLCPLFIACSCGFIILFWPFLWSDPVEKFRLAFSGMAKMHWEHTNLYFGEFIPGEELPWHYNFAWIGITTPIIYLLLFTVGFFIALARIGFLFSDNRKNSLLAWTFILILGSLGAPIYFHAVLFDGWRHHFYVYPSILILSALGFEWILARRSRALVISMCAAVVISWMGTARYMIRWHPYQHIYFNSLISREARRQFDLDYWGLSYREGLEYLVKTFPSGPLSIYIDNLPPEVIIRILPAQDRQRIQIAESPLLSDYFLGNYRWHEGEYFFGAEIYNVMVDGVKIMTIQKVSK